MRKLFCLIIGLSMFSTVALGQDRPVTVIVPEAKLVRIQILCDIFRESREPVAASWTLTQCMSKYLYQMLQLANRRYLYDELTDVLETDAATFEVGLPIDD
jgi:hypothetical protein